MSDARQPRAQTRPRRPQAEELRGQQQAYPARQSQMKPLPQTSMEGYRPAGKLEGRVALITGADSGIGRAVALAFALEGADVSIVYDVNVDDAADTRGLVEATGRKCVVIQANVRSAEACTAAVEKTVKALGRLDVLVNNAAFQQSHARLEEVSGAELARTFETNVFAYVYLAQAAIPYLERGGAIINTGSIVGLVGHPHLLAYTASKGAVHALTKSLALQLADRGVRVNCVVPGPVWTPNIPGTMPIDEVENFGHEVALKRPGQPDELAPVYVLLASDDASFMTGSLVEVTGGKLSSS